MVGSLRREDGRGPTAPHCGGQTGPVTVPPQAQRGIAESSRRTSVRGLVKGCHPGPSLVVTALATAIGAAIGLTEARLLLLAGAVLTGQLTIGWLNDLVDHESDVLSHRSDKPLVTGAATPAAYRAATTVAAVLCLPLSLALGWAAGLLHLVVVASGWAYDLRLKRTIWSWAPYVVAFGLLPAVVVLSLPGSPSPPWWGCLAGALLGVGAHLANALPDIEEDTELGVGGLPARIGARWTRGLAAASLIAATVVLAFAPPGPVGRAGWAALALAVSLLALGLGPKWRGHPRAPFVFVVGLAIVNVVLLVGRTDAWATTG